MKLTSYISCALFIMSDKAADAFFAICVILYILSEWVLVLSQIFYKESFGIVTDQAIDWMTEEI